MKDGFRVFIIVQVVNEIIGVDVIDKLQRRKILPLIGVVQAVDDNDVVVPKLIKPPDNSTADEPGPACDDCSHDSDYVVGLDIFPKIGTVLEHHIQHALTISSRSRV